MCETSSCDCGLFTDKRHRTPDDDLF